MSCWLMMSTGVGYADTCWFMRVNYLGPGHCRCSGTDRTCRPKLTHQAIVLSVGVLCTCREEITRLLQLAFHFKQIKKFMQQEQYPADGHKSKYRCALCSGLDGEWQGFNLFSMLTKAAAPTAHML